jgi:hypothetical protein
MVAVALAGRSRLTWAVLFLALAALTKEAYVLLAWATAAWLWMDGRRRRSLLVAVLPVLPLAAWTLWVSSTAGAVAPGLHHLALPGMGILAAVPAWLASRPAALATILGAGMASLVLACLVVSTLRGDRLLSLSTAAWGLLGLALSVNVWEVPTNAVRVLAPVWTLGLLTLAAVLARSRERGKAT